VLRIGIGYKISSSGAFASPRRTCRRRSCVPKTPNQPTLYLKWPLAGIVIGCSGAGLQVGTLVQETDEALWLDIPFPKQSHLRARLLKRKRPFAPNDGILYADSRGRRSHWLVNIPWADVTGMLVENGRKAGLLLSREAMILYLSEMYDKAGAGDVIWAQCVRCTNFNRDVRTKILEAAGRGYASRWSSTSIPPPYQSLKRYMRRLSRPPLWPRQIMCCHCKGCRTRRW